MRDVLLGFCIGSAMVVSVWLAVITGKWFVDHGMAEGIFLREDDSVSVVCGEAIIVNESGKDSDNDIRERFEWALARRHDCP